MKRESYLDIAKGFGIILVILAHLEIGPCKEWIYSFHLPLFFIISGICFNCSPDFKGFLIKKAKRCLIPYCFLGLIIVLAESKTGYLYGKGFIFNLKYLLIQERYSTLWFLATLFIASVVFYFILKICKSKPVPTLIISLILSILFVYLDQYFIRALPWNIDTAFIVLGFISVGYYIKNFGSILDTLISTKGFKRYFLTFIFLLVNITCYGLNKLLSGLSLEMYWNSYGYYPFMLASAISGTLFVIMLSASIKCTLLEKLGKHSMTYFALHQSVFLWPYTLLFRHLHILIAKPSIQNIVAIPILFILITLSCFIVDKILRSTKLKFLLGE